MSDSSVFGNRPGASIEELWALMDELPARVSFIDRERRHRYVNREYADFVGLPASAILGKTVPEIYGADEATKLRPFADAALAGETVRWEGWVKSPAGADHYIRRVYKPHWSRSGEIDGYFALVRDITEHRRAQTEQQRLSQLLRDAIESIPNGFAVYDADERLVLCNQAFASLYHDTPAAMVGAHVTDNLRRAMKGFRIFDSREISQDQVDVQAAMERLRDADQHPVEVQLTNGRWIQITSHPTADHGRVYIRTDITRLKQAEALLRESEQRFRHIVERNPLAVWVNEVQSGRILYESPAAAALLGRTWQGPGPQHATEYYVDIADRADYVRLLRKRGEVDNYALRLKKVDGTEFWASVTARVFEHEGRELAVTSMMDLTETKRREDELRQARETLEDAIESLAEGFALWDADDRLVICNQRFREINRLTADLLVPGIKWEDFARAGAERGQYVAARGQVNEWLEERKLMRAQLAGDFEFEQSDGRWFTRSIRRTRQGGRVQIRKDITEHKRMEQALRESEALFRSITLAHPVPLTIVRVHDGKILYASQAVVELFRMTIEDALSTPAASFYKNPTDRERFVETLRREGAVNGFEVEMRKRDGSTFWASLTSRRIAFQGEDTIVTAIADITERRTTEQELAHQREALYQSEKLNALGVLLAGVAHELNNPLSVVVGQSLLLRDASEDEKTRKRAERIASAADRCSRIVKTFLAMARQSTPARKEVNLNQIIESALEITAYTLRSADIDVRCDLAPALPPVWGEPDQLTQVVMNLIVNAEQAMADKIGKRKLQISTTMDDGGHFVQLRVRDNGPGIPEDIRSRIFEPFFTTKEVGVGTGVGLSVSRGIIQAHEGSIEVESRLGKGATFVISLPHSPRREAEHATVSSEHKPRAHCKVLVVDDEPDVAEMLADILTLDGHQIEVAGSGNAALRILAQRQFDIILSDMRMPDVDGPGLYTRIKNAYPHLVNRIVFLTGDALGPAMRAFLDQTGLPCLEKPLDPGEVRELVGRAHNTAAGRVD